MDKTDYLIGRQASMMQATMILAAILDSILEQGTVGKEKHQASQALCKNLLRASREIQDGDLPDQYKDGYSDACKALIVSLEKAARSDA